MQGSTGHGPGYQIEPGSYRDVTVTAPSDHVEVRWLGVDPTDFHASPVSNWTLSQSQCESYDGTWMLPWGREDMAYCSLPSEPRKYRYYKLKETERSYTLRIENNSDWPIASLFYVSYLCLTPEKRYIKLRSIDETSVLKYGRRVMDLVWPLGQHPTQMQAIIDSYLLRHSEPVSMANITIKGDTDEQVSYILSTKINDSERIIHPGLSMDDFFFVNSIDVSHSIDDTINGSFDLEQVRDMEKKSFFKWGISRWGDGDVWAP